MLSAAEGTLSSKANMYLIRGVGGLMICYHFSIKDIQSQTTISWKRLIRFQSNYQDFFLQLAKMYKAIRIYGSTTLSLHLFKRVHNCLIHTLISKIIHTTHFFGAQIFYRTVEGSHLPFWNCEVGLCVHESDGFRFESVRWWSVGCCVETTRQFSQDTWNKAKNGHRREKLVTIFLKEEFKV